MKRRHQKTRSLDEIVDEDFFLLSFELEQEVDLRLIFGGRRLLESTNRDINIINTFKRFNYLKNILHGNFFHVNLQIKDTFLILISQSALQI